MKNHVYVCALVDFVWCLLCSLYLVCVCVFLTKVIDILFMCCHGDVHIPVLTNLKVALMPFRRFCELSYDTLTRPKMAVSIDPCLTVFSSPPLCSQFQI